LHQVKPTLLRTRLIARHRQGCRRSLPRVWDPVPLDPGLLYRETGKGLVTHLAHQFIGTGIGLPGPQSLVRIPVLVGLLLFPVPLVSDPLSRWSRVKLWEG